MTLDEAISTLRMLPVSGEEVEEALDTIRSAIDRARDLAEALIDHSDDTGCTEDLTVTNKNVVENFRLWLKELDEDPCGDAVSDWEKTREAFSQLEKDFVVLIREVALNANETESALYEYSQDLTELADRRGIKLP